MSTPAGSTSCTLGRASHWRGPFATPCRCTEYEQRLATIEGEGEHVALSLIGIPPAVVVACLRAGMTSTADVAAREWGDLRATPDLHLPGMAALLYEMAARGLAHPVLLALAARSSMTRAALQGAWERLEADT